MLITLSEAAAMCERKSGRRVHRATVKGWGLRKRFRLIQCNGWKVDEAEFVAWAAKVGRLRLDLRAKIAGEIGGQR